VSTCPCGSSTDLDKCCEPIIKGKKKAKTPEALMRARYSAYVIGETEFIKTSNAPETAGDVDIEATKQWSKAATWEGFEIVENAPEGAKDRAELEFIAKYSVEGNQMQHHERSVFVEQNGTWYFLEGDVVKPKPIRRDGPRIGRNDPCPCGSGKKYKKCCAA